MDVMEYVVDAIDESYENCKPTGLNGGVWAMFQLYTLLDNILVDNPQLESYYREYADQLKLL